MQLQIKVSGGFVTLMTGLQVHPQQHDGQCCWPKGCFLLSEAALRFAVVCGVCAANGKTIL